MIPIYTCDNDDCPDVGRLFIADRDTEAVCPSCGWMLSGTGQAGEEVTSG